MHEREPHAAVRHPHAASGTTGCSQLLGVPRRSAAEVVPSVESIGDAPSRAARRDRDPDRRHRRRPAGGALRAGVLRAGHGQEHLRHRLLPAAEHRHEPLVSANRLLTTIAWQVGGARTYALEGAVFVARRRRAVAARRTGADRALAESKRSRRAFPTPAASTSCRRSPASAAPHWDPDARGTIVGLTRGTTRAHLARAALESIAFQSARSAATRCRRDARPPLRELRVDGGAAANDLLMQFQADLLGVPVVRPGSPRPRRSAPPISRARRSASGNPRARWPGTGARSDDSSPRCRATRHRRGSRAGRARSNARAAGTSRLRGASDLLPHGRDRVLVSPRPRSEDRVDVDPRPTKRQWPRRKSPGPHGVTCGTTHHFVAPLAHRPSYGAAARASWCVVARVTRLMRK